MRGAKSSMLAVAALAMGAVVWMMPGLASAFFSAPLVQCQSVTVPAGLPGCGSDPLTSGVASIDDEGDLDIEVSGAGASQTYTVSFIAPNGTPKALPDLKTGGQGNGLVRSPVFFPLGKVGAGNIVLSRAGQVQFGTSSTPPSSGTAATRNIRSLTPSRRSPATARARAGTAMVSERLQVQVPG